MAAAQAQAQIAIESAAPNLAEVPLYGRVEIAVRLKTTATNPFDPDDIRLDALVDAPSGKRTTLPGFYSRPFTRTDRAGKEVMHPAGVASWLVRIAFAERGPHQITLSARDRTGETAAPPIAIQVGEPESDGFLRASPRDPRYFEFDSGKAFWPLGVNLGWAGQGGLFDYDRWIPALATSKGSFTRLFLGPVWTTFAMETGQAGFGKIDLANAWKLDYTLDLMEQHGIKAILVLESHETLRDRGPEAAWDKSPHKRDNGGPLDAPRQFWDEPTMEKAFRSKLRYLVARYGAFQSVAAWELFNEPDLVRGFDAGKVRAWLERTTEHLATIDPYGHLVSASFSTPMGLKDIDNMPGIGLVQTHLYEAGDVAGTVSLLHHKRLGYGKPHVPTLVTADRAKDRAADDPKGLLVHSALWASIGAGASGGAMPWWWMTSTMPRGLHRRFIPAARFLEGIDWPGEKMRPISATFSYQKPLLEPFYRDLVIAGGPVSFGNTEYNLPKVVRIDPRRVRYGLPVAGILHGRRNMPSKHNPITIRIDLARSSVFDVHVGDVSGRGGARLKITLDGRSVIDENFPDPNDAGEPDIQTQYKGSYSIPLSAGTRTIKIENVGNDWLKAGFAFRDLFIRPAPPLVGLVTLGDNTGIAWIRHADRTYHRVVEQQRPVTTCPLTVMRITGLQPGSWRAELWDTAQGVVLKTQAVAVSLDGLADVRLPEIAADMAVKLKRVRRPGPPTPKQGEPK